MNHRIVEKLFFHIPLRFHDGKAIPALRTVAVGFCLASLINSVAYALEPGTTIPRSPQFDLPPLPPATDTAPKLDAPPVLPPLPAGEDTTPRFVLKAVRFHGNRAVDDATLQQQIAGYLGKAVSYADLEAMRYQLSVFYLQQGYLNSGAVLNDQAIQDGVVDFDIVEGRLSAVHVTGHDGLHEEYIVGRMQLDAEEALRRDTLQERFQLLLSDPLIERLNGALRPGAQPGETVLDLAVTRAQPYGLNVIFDNHTPPSIGSYTGRGEGFVRNLTGWGDLLALGVNYSEGSKGFNAFYSIPVTRYDTRLIAAFQANNADIVENALKRFNIETDFFNVEFGVSQPLYRSLQHHFSVDARFAYREVDSAIGRFATGFGPGDSVDGETRVSVLRLSQQYQGRFAEQAFSARSTFNVGFDAFNATLHPSGPDSRFFSWLGQLRFAQKLGDSGAQFLLRADIQLAADELLTLERYALGGYRSVRGYRENSLVRDEGYALSGELRYPLLMAHNPSEVSLQVAPFVDIGEAWGQDRNDHRMLFSAGVGLLSSWQMFDFQVYWAHPFHKRITSVQPSQYDLQDDGLHLQLTTKVF